MLICRCGGRCGLILTWLARNYLREVADAIGRAGWGANDGFEYWFPRPIAVDGPETEPEKPLVILGGGREVTKPKFELYETDDGSVNPLVYNALRAFLPVVFPGGMYDKEGKLEPEWHWTGVMGFTSVMDPFVSRGFIFLVLMGFRN